MPTLSWIGKEAVVNHHLNVPFHLLKDVPDLACGRSRDGNNLIVQGDNLVALKALLPYYAGQVKCIYIDPPYNTGNERWVYNDAVNSPEIRNWLGKVVGGEAEDLNRHDKWLCMMYPRLQLLKKFLRDDGVILVSIDDNELGNLTLLMREVFGPQNFVATLIWEKGKKGDAKFISVTHEYVVVFARSKATLTRTGAKWRRKKPGANEVVTHYAEVRSRLSDDHTAIRQEMNRWFKSLPPKHPAKAHKHYNWSDNRGLYFPDNFHGPDDGRESRPRYDILHPATGLPCKKPSTGWRWEEARTIAALAEHPPRIHFGQDHTTIPCRKSYLFEVDQEPFQSVFYKDGRAATLEVEALLGKGAFEFPKDTDVLAGLIGLVTGKDDLILDSFAGSGTTAHAVLKLNSQDGGRRRFVIIEMEPKIARDITSERIRRVVNAHTNPTDETVNGFGSFRFCELGEPLFNQEGMIRENVTFPELAKHVYFTETGGPLLDDRVPNTPFLGEHHGVGVYLLFNGILGDKSASGGNILTRSTLADLPPFEGQRVVYCAGNLLGRDRLQRERIIVRQTPYEIRVG